ncbi:MAG: HipA domain-containing protein, partial [Paludibacteraceae bacterium]|nr:HipA domain-containing protein [Paludibacteraceae bacterium]
LIGNRDDHARNFSFIYTDGWHLSPAYDLLPCGIEGDYHTTTVRDNPLPTKADVLALAKEQGLNVQRAETIWEEMAHQTHVR